MRSSPPVRVFFPVVFLPILVAGGNPLQQVWEVHLAEKLIEPVGWTAAKSHPVLEVAYSPDGSKLAATVDDHYDAKRFKTHLLILDAKNPQAAFCQFDLETCGTFLEWAADGKALLVCGMVVRLDDGSSCDQRRTSTEQTFSSLGNFVYWLDAGRVNRSDRAMADLQCHGLGTNTRSARHKTVFIRDQL